MIDIDKCSHFIFEIVDRRKVSDTTILARFLELQVELRESGKLTSILDTIMRYRPNLTQELLLCIEIE